MATSDRLLSDIVIPRIYPSNYCICTPISCPSISGLCNGIHYQRIWYCASSWLSFFRFPFWCFHNLLGFSCHVGCSSQWFSSKFQTWSWGEDGHPTCCLWWNSFSSSVNQIIHCARSWRFYLTSCCYSVHPATTLVIPLYCLARNCHLQYPRPLPYIWNQNSWRWVDLSLSVDSRKFTLLFKSVYILSVKKQQRRGKTSIARLIRSFASKLSIISHSSSLFMLVWRWRLVVCSFTVPHLRGWFEETRLDCHIYAQCPWWGSFCRLHLVRFFRGCVLFIGRRAVLTCGRAQVLWLGVSCFSGSIEKWAVAITMSF